MHYSIKVKKFITFVILAKLMCSHRASGFIANISRPMNCQGSTATIKFDFDLEGGSIVSGSKVWYFNQYPIAQDTGSGFTALDNYTSRLTSHSGDGLALSNVTTADAGSYTYELVLVAGFTPKTATASLSVYIGPLNPSSPSGCLVKASQSGNTVKCTVSGNCGTPALTPSWVDFTTTDQFECKVSGTYKCCATGAVLPLCYSGSSNDFCTTFKCESNTTDTNMTSTPTTTLPPNDTTSNISIKVIVPAVVVPCGLLIIGAIVLAIFCVRRKARKNVRERPDGTSIQDKGNNIDGWKQSLGQGKTTDNLDTAHTTPDGFIIYPGPAALSTARSYKDNKYHGVTDQYSRPSPGTHHHQADYIPSTYTPARAYTHSGEKRLDVTDQYGRPYPGNYGNQTANFAGTYKSARNYAQKGKTYEGPQPVYNLMANSRLAYGQTAYYPQTGYYGQSDQDVYYSGGQQYSYGQRSRSHHDHSGRKPQRDYYSQYEMADYGSNGAGYRHTKQNPAFYY